MNNIKILQTNHASQTIQSNSICSFKMKLWSHIRFGENTLDNTTRWKSFCESYKDWQINRQCWNNWGGNRNSEDKKIQKFIATRPQTEDNHKFTKSAKVRNYTQEHKASDFYDLKRNYSITLDAKSHPSDVPNCCLGKFRRKRSDWIGDEMRNQTAKQAPGFMRSTVEVYEAGKIISKEKNSSDCGRKKERSGFFKSKKQQSPSEGDGCDCPESDNGTKCFPERKQNCATGEGNLTPSVLKCLPQNEENAENSARLCSDTITDKRRKKLPALSLLSLTPGKNYGLAASSSPSRSIPATCPSNARSSKQCTSRPSSPCYTPPAKRTPTNSLSRCGSSASAPPMAASPAKCPTLPTAPVACKKPCVPCQPPSPSPFSSPCPSPSPPSPCPPPSCPPPKNRCGSPPCPSLCPPPPPPPCCPPPSCPKMEALQFDPLCKALNFYMLNAPTSIRKDEVLVQIVYSGVCGTDLMIIEGKYPSKTSPVILGHEFSGIACAVGSGVSHIKCGDCIAIDPYAACHVCRYCNRGQFGACMCEGLNNSIGVHKDGGWAEFVVVHKNQVHSIPPCLGLGQAVLVQPLSCIVNAMSKIDIPFGSDIVIQGTGVSGCLWASVLHLQGHKNVIACDISEYKRKLFQCLDLKYCILAPEKMCDIRADIVIDCTGSSKCIERSIKMLNPQGQLCIFGITSPDDEITIQPFEITKKEAKIIPVITNTNSFAKAITLAEMMGCRYLDYEKLGIQTFKLGQFEGALKMKRCGEISKVVFKIQNSK